MVNYYLEERIRNEFEQGFENWVRHSNLPEVQLSSNSSTLVNCEGYKRIKTMGTKILPLIREVYERKSIGDELDDLEKDSPIRGMGLTILVHELCNPQFEIPTEIRGIILAMKQYTINWLDENMHKYI